MLKKLHVRCCPCGGAGWTVTAWAQDHDHIEYYDVDVTPNTEDGSLRITGDLGVDGAGGAALRQELKIGVPERLIRRRRP